MSSDTQMHSMFGYSSGCMAKQSLARLFSFNRSSQARNTLELSQLLSTLVVTFSTSWSTAQIILVHPKCLLLYYHRSLWDKEQLYSQTMSALVWVLIGPRQLLFTRITPLTLPYGCSLFPSYSAQQLDYISTTLYLSSLEGASTHASASCLDLINAVKARDIEEQKLKVVTRKLRKTMNLREQMLAITTMKHLPKLVNVKNSMETILKSRIFRKHSMVDSKQSKALTSKCIATKFSLC